MEFPNTRNRIEKLILSFRLNYGRGITTYSKNIDEWLDPYFSFLVLQYDILS